MSDHGHHSYSFFILDIFISLVLKYISLWPQNIQVPEKKKIVVYVWDGGAIGQIKKNKSLLLKTKVVWVCLAPLAWKGRIGSDCGFMQWEQSQGMECQTEAYKPPSGREKNILRISKKGEKAQSKACSSCNDAAVGHCARPFWEVLHASPMGVLGSPFPTFEGGSHTLPGAPA